jgi:SAM-dependent methyltransferase
MNDRDYRDLLLKQLKNSKKRGIKAYLTWLFQEVHKHLEGDYILEIGAGAGISRNFLSSKYLTQTDLLFFPKSGVKSKVDAQNLPFRDNFFDSAFAVDAIHHIPKPHLAILELCRVVKPGGVIVIVEPYVSFFSYLFYKLFHFENITWKYQINIEADSVSNLASEGEQSVLQALLNNQNFINLLENNPRKLVTICRKYISPISFLLTGGLTRPIPISNKIISVATKFESYIPQAIMQFIAFRQILILSIVEKNES